VHYSIPAGDEVIYTRTVALSSGCKAVVSAAATGPCGYPDVDGPGD